MATRWPPRVIADRMPVTEAIRQGAHLVKLDVDERFEVDGQPLERLLNEAGRNISVLLEVLYWQANVAWLKLLVDKIHRRPALTMVMSYQLPLLKSLRKLDRDLPLIIATPDRYLPDTEENLMETIRGVVIPITELPVHAGSHSIPLFINRLNDPGKLDPRVRLGIAGVITDYPTRWPR